MKIILCVNSGKKGQLKIQQMAFVLIAVTLLFVMAGLFLLTVKLSSLKGTATNLEEKNAMLLVTKLANSPEFSCGESFSRTQIACIDEDKLMALSSKVEYEAFWDVANIEIRRIYPGLNVDKECTLANYPNCNVIKIYESDKNSGPYKSNFVSLCRKEFSNGEVYNKCDMARLLVSYEVYE